LLAAVAAASSGSAILTPPSVIAPSSPSRAASRFIAGEPMKPATIVFTGLS
jgi:hypothetical protein